MFLTNSVWNDILNLENYNSVLTRGNKSVTYYTDSSETNQTKKREPQLRHSNYFHMNEQCYDFKFYRLCFDGNVAKRGTGGGWEDTDDHTSRTQLESCAMAVRVASTQAW